MKAALALLAACLPLAGEVWVQEMGGSLARNSSGDVVGVSLRGAWVTDGDLSRLAQFPKLQSLDLSRTHVNDYALESLKSLAVLRDLDLTYNEHVTDAGIARLRPLKSLERLLLEGTKITDSGIPAIASLTNLRELNLRNTQVTDSAIEELEPLGNLERLAIGGNRIAGFGLIYLRALPKLKHLDLSGMQLTDDGIWSVSLTDLNIGLIGELTRLESLNIGSGKPGPTAAIPDGGVRESSTIRVTDLGLQKLSALVELQSLDLREAKVGAAGIRTLAALPKLTQLVLAEAAPLDQAALTALTGLKKLRTVDLSGVELPEQALRDLFSGRPVRIIRGKGSSE